MIKYSENPNEEEVLEIKVLLKDFLEETIVDSNVEEKMYDKMLGFAHKKLCDLIDNAKKGGYRLHSLKSMDEIVAFAITQIVSINKVVTGRKYIWYVSPKYRSKMLETEDAGNQYAIKYLNSNIDEYFKRNNVEIEEISANHKNKKNMAAYFKLGYIPETANDERVFMKKLHGFSLPEEDMIKIAKSIENGNVILTDLSLEQKKIEKAKINEDRGVI